MIIIILIIIIIIIIIGLKIVLREMALFKTVHSQNKFLMKTASTSVKYRMR